MTDTTDIEIPATRIDSPDGAGTGVSQQPTQIPNRHDARDEVAECNELMAAIAARGYGVDLPRLQADAERWALMHLLVEKGLITEDEANTALFARLSVLLRAGLQQAEEQALAPAGQQQQRSQPPSGPRGPKLQAVRRGGLMVARR